jgi:hypothetical protein
MTLCAATVFAPAGAGAEVIEQKTLNKSTAVAADELEQKFGNPPEESKPWCYWYWLNGNISKEGITKDLEAMAKVGIKLAMIGNISGIGKISGIGDASGSIRMFSPEWYELTLHAFREANRLSVDLMMFNGPGWSQSGGPWIKPEQSMRRVAWSEFPATGGAFSQKVRPKEILPGQDIAVLAVPRPQAVTIKGEPASSSTDSDAILMGEASWIWQPDESAAVGAPVGTRNFKREFQADPAKLLAAHVKVTADMSYRLAVNGKPVLHDDDWKTQETASIKEHLKAGINTISVAVKKRDAGPAGLIAAVRLVGADGKTETLVTDASWQVSKNGNDGWVPAQVLGPLAMMPWELKDATALRFAHTEPFTARSLVVHGKGRGKLYALRDGEREFIADIHAAGGKGQTDFLPDAVETFSFPDVTAREFELVPAFACRVELGSAPVVAQVIEKQMGRMHPTPSPSWESYIFPASAEPSDTTSLIRQQSIINLTDKLDADGTLNCTLPAGDWTVIHFGMVTTGKKNAPAPPEATGLEVDKMSKTHIGHHFNHSIRPLMERMSPEERAAFKGITIDSYEVGAQNWTDDFAAEFETRNGYDPILLLPVLTGRAIDSAKASDQFLWDLRRTVADMIAENYVGGLREIAHENNLRIWLENYGHWGFPGEFTIYGGYADDVAGEFWTYNRNLGTIECRAASSVGHTYGKRRIYVEAFTSNFKLDDHPYRIKARGDELFCEGVNHFVLHVYAHQPQDGVPGLNPWFGTAFHRNNPWFNHSRNWVRYLQRCHYMLQQGEPVADVAVYIGDFAPQMTGPAKPVPQGYDYDYIGSDAILRKLDVVDGQWVVYDENDPGRIAARWKVLAMPKVDYIRPQVARRLAELRAKGGVVVDGVPVTEATLQAAGIAPLVSQTSCPVRWKVRRLDDGGKVFFLSNFGKTGPFEATLRVADRVPELFNPVTGEIRKMARYKSESGTTRITFDVKDRADSFFVVFRDKPTQPSVLSVALDGRAIGSDVLELSRSPDGKLVGRSAQPGTYTVKLSDGDTKSLTIPGAPQPITLDAASWQTKPEGENGHTVLFETRFDLPTDFAHEQRVLLDLGKVEAMATVKLNGKTFDTLWMPPFVVDVGDVLKPKGNELQILIISTANGTAKLSDVNLRPVRALQAEGH